MAALLAGALLAVPATGCGDGPICASEIVIVISSIADGSTVTTDVSPNDGVQINVPVRSNLRSGDEVTLIVLDAMGTEVSRTQAGVDDQGDVLFTEVDVPEGLVILRAEADSGECGTGFDEIQFNVLEGAGCGLSIREGLLDSDYYAPLQVLNSSNDSDANLPNFQANIDISTGTGSAVELFVLDIDSAVETSAGTAVAADPGVASFAITLAQGRQVLRAACTSTSGAQSSSANVPFLVDTVAPTCEFAFPALGTSVIPQMDTDGDPNNGTQITMIGRADAGASDDVEGEAASFTINGMASDGTLLDSAGESTLDATFDSDALPYALTFSTQDRAGNTCTAMQSTNYVTQGCAISLVSPLTPISFDSDPVTPGMQVEMIVDVDAACEGRTVTTDCGEGTTMATVPMGGGNTNLLVTACPDDTCQISDACTLSVTNDAGFETSVGTTLVFDNQAPTVGLQFVNPVATCGGAVAPSSDTDPIAPGVQIDVRVIAPDADVLWVEVTNPNMPPPTIADVGGDATITLADGLNDIEAVATDELGNEGRSGICQVALLDIVIGFDPPVDDGVVGASEGTVNGNDVTFDLCGTVSENGATVDVSIDGGAAQTATVMGMNWCLSNVTLSQGTHTIDVTANTGMQFGQGSTTVVVDLDPPTPVGALAASVVNRHSVELSWTAPDNDGGAAAAYIIKVSDTPLSDANFDSTGTVLSGPIPSSPGNTDINLAEQLLAGADHYFGVAALDSAGNRSTAQTLGPVVPDFDATGVFPATAPNDGDNSLGYQVARGDFNGDGFSDVAVAAPFMGVDLGMGVVSGVGTVNIYFGSATGAGNPLDPPDVTITGTEQDGQFGQGLTSLEWTGDNATDLAVGAPLADGINGRVFVFHGGAGLTSATSANDADVTINTAPSGWFFFSAMGYSLAGADFDGDNTDDLAIAAPFGNDGAGGVAILYGGHGETVIALDSADPIPAGNARILAIQGPDPVFTYDIFGQTLVNLGPTEGMGDGTDDLGVAFPDRSSAFVLRGRAQPGATGITVSAINPAQDLEIQDNSTDTDDEIYFGSSMGSIADQNGDGGREIVIGAWGEGNYDGRVFIVDGDGTGTVNVGAIAMATINHGVAANRHFGAAILNNATAQGSADVDNDGAEDLLIVGGFNATTSLFVWYGGSIPTGTTDATTAQHKIEAPTAFTSAIPGSDDKSPIQAAWIGDLNGDGLEDVCIADYMSESRDGGFQLLWDDGI